MSIGLAAFVLAAQRLRDLTSPDSVVFTMFHSVASGTTAAG
jgi:hypothetical protein